MEVREADYTRPDTLNKALAGIDTLMMISGSEIGQRVAQHRNVIDAAKQAGIRRVVHTSLLHAERSTLDLAPEHVETEALLQASGLSVTLLRNGWYTENYTASVGPAVAVLTSAGHDGKTYELAGDSAYTLADLAAEISRQTGKDIPYKNLPPADYTVALIAAGVPAPWPQALPALDVEAAKGALFDDGHVLAKLIGRSTTSLKESVAAALRQV